MPHGWSSADAQRFIHGRAPFSSCFSPSVSFLGANGAAWGPSLGGWGEPMPQRVAAINGASVRKQPVSYPGNAATFPGLRWLRGTDGSLDSVHGNSDKGGGTLRGLPSPGIMQQRGVPSGC